MQTVRMTSRRTTCRRDLTTYHSVAARAMSAALPSASATTAATPQRSTRGASKQRRDQINVEIQRLRDLLPLSDSIKDRLYQLQIMSLGCIYMRKHRYLQHVLSPSPETISPIPKGIEVGKALRGFMLLLTRTGKMLHVSENASEYLGHSVEEIMCQGDSIYDLVDSRDHAAVQAELASGPPLSANFPEERVFICRLNLTRAAAKRQLQYHKVWATPNPAHMNLQFILLQGRYIHPAEYYQNLQETGGQQTQPMFAAYCQPLINPENAETMASGNTAVFSSQHYLDMRFKEVDHMCAYHLGYGPSELEGTSWYRLVHPSHVHDVAFKHRLLCQEKEGSILSLIRMQTASGDWIWLHTVFAVRGNFQSEMFEGRRVRHVLHCYYQILTEMEAATLQANSWIYNMRHTYPAAFPNQAESPDSEHVSSQHDRRKVTMQDRPASPVSPAYIQDPFQSCDFNQFIKQEPFVPIPLIPQHQFTIPCEQFQIKVEIPMKAQSSMFTPDSSSPESAASLHSSLMSQPFPSLDTHPLLDEMQTKGSLPELRDDLDEFFRQVEEVPAAPAPPIAPPPPPLTHMPRHSPPQAQELYKYLNPALFNQQKMLEQSRFVHSHPHHRTYSVPDCGMDPFMGGRKMSWAM